MKPTITRVIAIAALTCIGSPSFAETGNVVFSNTADISINNGAWSSATGNIYYDQTSPAGSSTSVSKNVEVVTESQPAGYGTPGFVNVYKETTTTTTTTQSYYHRDLATYSKIAGPNFGSPGWSYLNTSFSTLQNPANLWMVVHASGRYIDLHPEVLGGGGTGVVPQLPTLFYRVGTGTWTNLSFSSSASSSGQPGQDPTNIFSISGSTYMSFAAQSDYAVQFALYKGASEVSVESMSLNLYSPTHSTTSSSSFVDGPHKELVSHTEIPALPVPEPETYALLLAGLGLMASVARRRTRS
ncbi:MAG: PEP-CTERM sorting domain-containing protein [Rhodocyclaceae bacterium]|nr:PEP-CTERM sorting domain-containing protein [Rhodocyclaceae bacterium]